MLTGIGVETVKEVINMVERTEAKGLEEFEGKVESIEIVESKLPFDDGTPAKQFQITMSTEASKTGNMYQWLRISQTATDTTIPEGSSLDRYLQAVERIHPEAKKIDKIEKALAIMVGNNYRFVKEQLGKAYGGKAAADYWIPAAKI